MKVGKIERVLELPEPADLPFHTPIPDLPRDVPIPVPQPASRPDEEEA